MSLGLSMNRKLNGMALLFGLLGAVLLLNLVLPIGNLLVGTNWATAFAALRQPEALQAAKVSLLSSAIAIVAMTLFGVPLGYLLARADLPLKRLWIGLVFLPMVVPDLAGGILLLRLFGPYGPIGRPFDTHNLALTNNIVGIVLVQIFVAAPFVVASSLAAFANVDRELEAAAGTLGDSAWQVFSRVSLPLAWPGIAIGITLAWIRALGEFGATLVMAYNPHTLPVFLWVKFESEGLAGALPIAFCLVFLAVVAVGVSMNLNRFTGVSDVLAPLGRATKWDS
jgi:molybdate/tungstate transport system permease protein